MLIFNLHFDLTALPYSNTLLIINKEIIKMHVKYLIAINLLMLTQSQSYHHIKHQDLQFETKCPDSAGFKPTFIISCDYENYYQKLRNEYNIDHLIANSKSELECIALIMNWVNNLWEHNPDNIPLQKDAYSILHETIYEHRNFRCVEYATVLTAALWSIGIPCRKLNLKTSDVETREYAAGHVVCEAYLPSLRKWVMLDPQANIIIKLGKKPLNAVELQKAISKKKKLRIYTTNTDVSLTEYINFITPYLYYFDSSLEINNPYHSGQMLMLVPIHAKPPRIFQRHTHLHGFSYTNSTKCFYPKLC